LHNNGKTIVLVMKDLNYRLQNCPCHMRFDYGLQILILMAMFQLKFFNLPNLVFLLGWHSRYLDLTVLTCSILEQANYSKLLMLKSNTYNTY